MINKVLVTLFATILAACAGGSVSERLTRINQTVDDYIVVSELEEVDKIRTSDMLSYEQVTEDYIVVTNRGERHLLKFSTRCRELSDVAPTPDIRYDSNTLSARFDTFRGCRIHTFYKINKGQAQELIALGKVP